MRKGNEKANENKNNNNKHDSIQKQYTKRQTFGYICVCMLMNE